MGVTTALDRVRQPEYTGENRCLPCTVVNLLIAAVLSVVVGGLWWEAIGPGLAPVAGIAVFAACASMIYLRGYLVPGTPTLTKRYLPESVLRRFDKVPEQDRRDERERTGETAPTDVEPEEVLLEADAVEVCEDGADLCLTDDFEAAWYDRMDRIDDPDPDDIVSALDIPGEEYALDDYDDAVVLKQDGRRIGQWESEAALIADLAGAAVLDRRHGDWRAYSSQDRSRVLKGLRIFLTRCPSCAGTVTIDEETRESCCREFEVVAATCDACDARMLEQRL